MSFPSAERMSKACFSVRDKIRQYIASWEAKGYPEGLPDEAPYELESNDLVPSYRRICRALLKNDLNLQSLGFTKPSCELYNILKRAELGIVKPRDYQLTFEGIYGRL